jgi:hypothetical protein
MRVQSTGLPYENEHMCAFEQIFYGRQKRMIHMPPCSQYSRFTRYIALSSAISMISTVLFTINHHGGGCMFESPETNCTAALTIMAGNAGHWNEN